MKDETYTQALGRYATGAVGALIFTMLAFLTVTQDWFGSQILRAVFIMALAILQLGLQLYTFLHLGDEKHPRWKSHAFSFTMFILLVVVVGSIWIMMNLNYNMGMSPDAMQEYMSSQNKKGF